MERKQNPVSFRSSFFFPRQTHLQPNPLYPFHLMFLAFKCCCPPPSRPHPPFGSTSANCFACGHHVTHPTSVTGDTIHGTSQCLNSACVTRYRFFNRDCGAGAFHVSTWFSLLLCHGFGLAFFFYFFPFFFLKPEGGEREREDAMQRQLFAVYLPFFFLPFFVSIF